jgi:hypothetical protein
MIKKPKKSTHKGKQIIKKVLLQSEDPKENIQVETDDNPNKIIEEQQEVEGKKFVMKNLKMVSEFESFYSHGEATLIGKRFFGKSIISLRVNPISINFPR